MKAHTQGGSESRAASGSSGEQHTESEAETAGNSKGTSQEVGRGMSQSIGKAKSKTVTKGMTPSISEEEGESVSQTIQPFHAYTKRRVPSSRTFLPEQEFLTLWLQKIKAQPRGHFIIKVPGKRAVFARAPFVQEPHITQAALARGCERIFQKPHDMRLAENDEGRKQQASLPAPQPFLQPNHITVQCEDALKGNTAYAELTEPESWGDTREPRIPISTRGRRKAKVHPAEPAG